MSQSKAKPTRSSIFMHCRLKLILPQQPANYEGWNFNGGNYLFTTDTK